MSIFAMAMRHVRLCWILLPLLGAACADLRPDGAPARSGPPGRAGYEDVSKAAATLLEGIRLYENGNFKEAIAAFGAPDVQAAPPAIRVDALKYTAFSYCVLENYAQCRHAFDLALSLDPDFALRSSEHGHPMWGPVFDAAKATSEQDRTHTSLDRERERWRGVDLWRAR